MEIIIKSSQVMKTGTGSKGDWELIRVTTEDGTEFTTFDKKAKHLTAGAIIDIGNPKTKEGKLSFDKVVNVVREGAVQTTIQPANGDTMEKRASIETQCAVKAVLAFHATIVAAGLAADDHVIKTIERAWIWCDSRIPVGKMPNNGKLPAKVEIVPEPSASEGHFKTAGEFWSAATKRWGTSQTELVVILGENSAKDITDFDWAWLELEKKCGGK